MTCHNCHGCCDHGTSEALRRAEDRNSGLNSQVSSLQGQLSSKSTEVAEKNTQIAIVNNELTTTKAQLTETKGELTVSRGKVEELTGLFTNLQIESNNKDKDLEIKSKDIRGLKLELSESQEKIFDYELREQEKELDELIQHLGVGRQRPRELRRAYQQLFRARENYNRDNIEQAENQIEDIKDVLIEGGIDVDDFQKLCRKCEKFVKLKIERSKVQEQQYEARQEVPPRNN
jgi:chromosome segregation ATPase